MHLGCIWDAPASSGPDEPVCPDDLVWARRPRLGQTAPSDPDEPVLFASFAKKRSTYNINQSRVLIVTTHRIYMFEDEKMSRKHKIGHLAAIIKSKNSPEFVLIFPELKNLHLEGVSDV